jgi:hypothetical protein
MLAIYVKNKNAKKNHLLRIPTSSMMDWVTASVTLTDTDLRTTGTLAPVDFLPPEKVFSDRHCPPPSL